MNFLGKFCPLPTVCSSNWKRTTPSLVVVVFFYKTPGVAAILCESGTPFILIHLRRSSESNSSIFIVRETILRSPGSKNIEIDNKELVVASCNCMAFGLLSQRVSDLCLGKPALRPLPVSSSVRDTILALRSSGESHLSVWSCDHRSSVCVTEGDVGACRCVGKVCMVDVVCYLSREENRRYPGDALKAPLTEILPKSSDGIVRHVETSSR